MFGGNTHLLTLNNLKNSIQSYLSNINFHLSGSGLVPNKPGLTNPSTQNQPQNSKVLLRCRWMILTWNLVNVKIMKNHHKLIMNLEKLF